MLFTCICITAQENESVEPGQERQVEQAQGRERDREHAHTGEREREEEHARTGEREGRDGKI